MLKNDQNYTYEKTGHGGYSLAVASRFFFFVILFPNCAIHSTQLLPVRLAVPYLEYKKHSASGHSAFAAGS